MRASTLLLLTLLAPALAAQDRRPPTGAVEPFARLIGRWEGPATISLGPRGTLSLSQREWVATAAGGSVITITGQGREAAQPEDAPPAFDAYGVIYTGRDGQPAFRSFIKEGRWLDPAIELLEHGFRWSYQDPRAGQVRYTMTLSDDDEWHEVGERAQPDGSWVRFMEMRLRRVAD